MYEGSNFINGHWISAPKFFQTINPSNQEVLTQFPLASSANLESSVVAARKAFKSWSKISRVKRSDYFFDLANLIKRDQKELAEIISLETGKSLNESNAEVIESLHMCQVVFGSGRTPCGDWMASEISEKDAYVMRKPKGVAAVITPFNFPLAIILWTSAPAIVEGNCVVHKPSELTPWIAEKLARLYQEAGFPEGVYNLITGDGNLGKDLVEHSDINCILFTGSYKVGQSIRRVCAETFNKTCACETGSKSAVIVFADGNPKLAMDASIASAFKLTGQRCVSASRILIQQEIYDKFCDEFSDRASKITIGDPFENPAPYCGPIISERQLGNIQKYNDQVKSGIMLKGGRLDHKGFYLTPHVYKATWEDKPYLKEEVFGPHVALIPFKDQEEAAHIYNDTNYGLALGIITDNFRTMRYMRDECIAGMLYFGSGTIGASCEMPFGGCKMSGNGYKSAAATWKAVIDEVAVTINYDEKITWAQGLK